MRWQRVKWGLFPNVDLVDFGVLDTEANVVLIVKAKGVLYGVVNGELCDEVNTNANAILNAIPNAEGNGVVKGSAQACQMFGLEPISF